jgi:DNA-directed RNA polymerase subunit beta
MLTVKSDDIQGRSGAFDAIVKGNDVTETNIPEAFNVLLNYLRGLSLDVQLLNKGENK